MTKITTRFAGLILAVLAAAAVFSFYPTSSYALSQAGGQCKASMDCDQSQGLYCDTSVSRCKLPCNTGKVLCVGATGSDVGKLQQELNSQYMVSAGRGALTVDCIFGDGTKAAVMDYQMDTGLASVDGMAGPETLGALGITISGQPPTGGSCATGGTGNPGPNPAGSGNPCGDNRLIQVGGICVPDASKSGYISGSLAGSTSLADLIFTVIQYLLVLSGLIAVIALIIGGFWYITSAGNEEQSEKGRKAITSAIIGLVVVILAYAIVRIITQTLTTNNVLQRNNTTTTTIN